MTDFFAIRSRHIVTRDGVVDGFVVVREGFIAGIARAEQASQITNVMDAGDAWVLPGLVDTHVHVNEPGRAEWEGFDTATRAAAAGGVTTIVDMPLNSIPATIDADALRAKRAAAEGRCHVNVGFWGGIVPGNAREIEFLAREGALGFKCFLVPSGVDEFPHVREADLHAAIPHVRKTHLPLLAHCEVPEPIEQATARLASADPRRYATWLASRPWLAESKAIRMLGRQRLIHGEFMGHIVHLSSADALAEAFVAERGETLEGAPPEWRQTFERPPRSAFTIETCPHYLCFNAEEVSDGATVFKCAPPIRERANRERLWDALKDGTIELIVSDHSPCPPAMKDLEGGNFMKAWGGIASLEVGLAAVWTEARRRDVPLERVVIWMARNPSVLAGLNDRGVIETGRRADLIVFDPDAEWTVEPERLHQRHKVTPYAGRRLTGVVRQTYVGGRPVYEDGRIVSEPLGALALRGSRPR